MKNIVLLDFASEMNRGDAAMQEAIIDITKSEFPDHKQKVVAVYGDNQADSFKKHFDCSLTHGAEIIGGVRKTYNPLSPEFSNIKNKKWLNLFAMFMSYLQLFIFFISFKTIFIGRGKETINSFKESDFIIWNGRNFRDRNGIGEFYDLLAMLLHPLFCIIMKKKVFSIGVSIWPLQYKASRALLKFVLSKCVYVTAREDFSLHYAKKELKLTNTIFKPDLSYYFINKYGLIDKDIERNKKLVSVTLVDWKEDGPVIRQQYKESITSILLRLVEDGYDVQIVPQVYYEWEGYQSLLEEIYDSAPSLKNKITSIERYLSPNELFDQYKRSEYLVATRMHSAIFALTHGCKMLCIPYDAGAKWHILTNMGLSDKYILPYQVVTPTSLNDLFTDLTVDKNYFDTISENIDKLIKDTPTCIGDIKKYL